MANRQLITGMTFKSNRIAEISAAAEALLDQVVRKTAFDIERAAKEAAPVDTGALKNSIHTVVAGADGYDKAASAVRDKHPKAEVFDKVEPDGPGEAVVAVAAGYGAYVEYGTTRAAAQPFLTPAVDAARNNFIKACGKAVGDAGAGRTAGPMGPERPETPE